MVNNRTHLDVSQINDFLYVSAWPVADHKEEIHRLGIRLILSMSLWKPSKELESRHVKNLWLPTFDSPILPIPIFMLNRGVAASKPIIRDNGKILVHCQAGKHRSVAMASCILISTGLTANQSMELIKEKRSIADPDIWYIKSRIQKYESMNNERK